MTDRERNAERVSGHPTWEQTGAAVLPRSPAPAQDADAIQGDRSVASWLGWSPTSWRSRGSK